MRGMQGMQGMYEQATQAATQPFPNAGNRIAVIVCIAFLFPDNSIAVLKGNAGNDGHNPAGVTTPATPPSPLGNLFLPSRELTQGNAVKDTVAGIAKASGVDIDLEVPAEIALVPTEEVPPVLVNLITAS